MSELTKMRKDREPANSITSADSLSSQKLSNVLSCDALGDLSPGWRCYFPYRWRPLNPNTDKWKSCFI